jgi:hypothetical protein
VRFRGRTRPRVLELAPKTGGIINRYNVVGGGRAAGGAVGGHNTLDAAYDEGGPGAGRVITVDSGPVSLQKGAGNAPLLEIHNTANPEFDIQRDGELRWHDGAGGGVEVELRKESPIAGRGLRLDSTLGFVLEEVADTALADILLKANTAGGPGTGVLEVLTGALWADKAHVEMGSAGFDGHQTILGLADSFEVADWGIANLAPARASALLVGDSTDLSIATGRTKCLRWKNTSGQMLLRNYLDNAYEDLKILSLDAERAAGSRARLALAASPHHILEDDVRVQKHLGVNYDPNSLIYILARDPTMGVSQKAGLIVDLGGSSTVGVGYLLGVAGRAIWGNAAGPFRVAGLDYIAGAAGNAPRVISEVMGVRAQLYLYSWPAPADYTITDGVAYYAVDPFIFGSEPKEITAYHSFYGEPVADPNIVDAYGFHHDDITQTSGVKRLLELGPATPYMRVQGGSDAPLGDTNLSLKYGANLHRFSWPRFLLASAGQWGMWMPYSATMMGYYVGLALLSSFMDNSSSIATSVYGVYFRQQSAPIAGNDVGAYTNNLWFRSDSNCWSAAQFRHATAVTNIRLFIGFSTQAYSVMNASDNPAGHYVGIQFSTNRADVNYQYVTKDGAAQVLQDSGIPADTNLHAMVIEGDSNAGEITITLYDSSLVEVGSHTFTANLPGAGTPMRYMHCFEPLANSARTQDTFWAYFGNRVG